MMLLLLGRVDGSLLCLMLVVGGRVHPRLVGMTIVMLLGIHLDCGLDERGGGQAGSIMCGYDQAPVAPSVEEVVAM